MSGFYTYELFGWRLSVMRPQCYKHVMEGMKWYTDNDT